MAIPKCQIVPLPENQVSFQVHGREMTRWHSSTSYPRPFLYPIIGPSKNTLTRMGHPGAADHDHHRSVWFAHEKLMGVNFWSDLTESQIRQQRWISYEDRDTFCRMAVALGWYDGHNPKSLCLQEVVIECTPLLNDEFTLEIQSRFIPSSESLTFQKSNFGLLAVRMAAPLSAHFGTGLISDSEGREQESNIFGKSARWMDYSGFNRDQMTGKERAEGITYFDHAQNASYPSKWHVRQDGWMGASLCRDKEVTFTKSKPLVTRYLLHIHDGKYNAENAAAIAEKFQKSGLLKVSKSKRPHRHFDISRD